MPPIRRQYLGKKINAFERGLVMAHKLQYEAKQWNWSREKFMRERARRLQWIHGRVSAWSKEKSDSYIKGVARVFAANTTGSVFLRIMGLS